ncbi:unnamed protein product [Caenorhabditis bovis]|uniref:Serpentine receptor class r-10 n=1 Tax=Caenorhabditis bovis TaxID=2654633 RepID=A0A8S1EGI7_9PELO|nr:unnamed protein product [Caenorhabditis bovis]
MYSFNSLRTLLQYIFGVQSILLNTFLIFLIWNRSPKQLGTYKYMMMYISIFEMIYSIIDIIVEPIVHSYRSTMAVAMYTKNSIFGDSFNHFLIATYCGFYGSSMAIFGVHFIYRYGSTTLSTRSRYFEGHAIVVWISIPIVFFVISMITIVELLPPNETMTKFIRGSFFDKFGIGMEDVTYVGAHFYPIDDQDHPYINYRSFYGIALFLSMIMFSMFCVLYYGIRCYLKIWRELSTATIVSKVTRRLQKQLFNALVVQTAIPMTLMYVPVAAVFTAPIFEMDFTAIEHICPITIAIYPAIDPLPSIIIIDAFWDAVYGKMDHDPAVFHNYIGSSKEDAPTIRFETFRIREDCQNHHEMPKL